ncbi:hypothetical protein M404DRAFT_995572 [Pisolithus tinctorius Marx 270]|uniref:Uncharacterized protein n=1 Tax=Pisolithus tinctorius Marx 270 TaxID=870435 RepID=A0A0C3JMK1_PISTI|nr:hypothetical protein M404DRAFT_995572 [Pisolithus tinctorius Marx 270]
MTPLAHLTWEQPYTAATRAENASVGICYFTLGLLRLDWKGPGSDTIHRNENKQEVQCIHTGDMSCGRGRSRRWTMFVYIFDTGTLKECKQTVTIDSGGFRTDFDGKQNVDPILGI